MSYTNILLWVSFFCAAYINLGLSLGGGYVGGVIGLLLFFIIIAQRYSFKEMSLYGTAVFCALAIMFFFVSVTASGAWIRNLRSYGLLLVSALIYSLLSRILFDTLTINRKQILSIVYATSFFVLILVILELLGPLKFISDSFRAIVFSDAYLYESIERDLSVFGVDRPKLFTQEPSHLAKGLGFLGFAIFAIAPERRSCMLGIIFVCISLFFTRSATVVIGLVFILLLMLNLRLSSRISTAVNFIVGLIIIVGGILVPTIASNLAGSNERAALIANTEDASIVERYLAPPELAAQILAVKPLFGIGLGNKEDYVEEVIDAFAKFPGYSFSRLYYDRDLSFGWYNAFFEGLACLGLFGLSVFLLSARDIYKSKYFHNDNYVFLSIVIIVGMFDSGFPAPRFWFYIALYYSFFCYGLLYHREKRRLQFPLDSVGFR